MFRVRYGGLETSLGYPGEEFYEFEGIILGVLKTAMARMFDIFGFWVFGVWGLGFGFLGFENN
jgi:hypothetical protein